MSVEYKSEFVIDDLPNDMLLIIFENLDVNELLYVRIVSSRWCILISNLITSRVLISVNGRSLKYYNKTLENVISILDNSNIPVKALKLVEMSLLLPKSQNLRLEYIGHHICELTLDDVQLEINALYQCLKELVNLEKLNIINCRTHDYDYTVKRGFLPKLRIIVIKLNRYDPTTVTLLKMLLTTSKAILSLCTQDFVVMCKEIDFNNRFGNRIEYFTIETLNQGDCARNIEYFTIETLNQGDCARNTPLMNLNVLFLNKCMNLRFLVVWSMLYDVNFSSVQQQIVDMHPNLETLIIEPAAINISTIQYILNKLKHLKILGIFIQDDENFVQEINFSNLTCLKLGYFQNIVSGRLIYAPNLTVLAVNVDNLTQMEIDSIGETFMNLTTLAVSFGKSMIVLNFINCLDNLKKLVKFDIRYSSRYCRSTPSTIMDFGKGNNHSSTSKRLKTLRIHHITIGLEELELIFEKYPFIENLAMNECHFRSTVKAIQLVCDKLKNLKNICYTHELHYPINIPPKSVKLLLDHYPTLKSLTFPKEPRCIDVGDADDQWYIGNQFLNRDEAASIHTIRHYYSTIDDTYDDSKSQSYDCEQMM